MGSPLLPPLAAHFSASASLRLMRINAFFNWLLLHCFALFYRPVAAHHHENSGSGMS